MTLRASVIIPTYSDWSRLELCLRALNSQSVPSSEFEIVVGNNDPDGGIPSDLVVPGNCSFVSQPKPGSYAARNLAVSASTAPVLFFTDSDCIPDERWIEEGLAILEREEGTDRIGGEVQMFPEGTRWTAAESYDRIFSLTQERYVGKGYSVTANLIVTRELFEQVGPFNEDLLSGGDKEWNLRATAQGHRIRFAPSAIVLHPARASFRALAKKGARVSQGLRSIKKRSRPLQLLRLINYLIPSIHRVKRILDASRLPLHQRLYLLGFDYLLRLSNCCAGALDIARPGSTMWR